MKKVKNFKAIFGLVSLFILYSESFAANITQIGRYSTVENKPMKAQINPLEAIQQVHFGKSILTVGEAINRWLAFSGYELVTDANQIPAFKSILSKPLPQVDRHFGPMSVQEGLQVLAGKEIFYLVVDPLNRKVNFKLTAKFARFNAKPKGAKA